MARLLEVIACTIEDAEEAESGGADRLELVRDLDRDGLSPTLSTLESVLRRTHLPVRVMLRENAGMSAGQGKQISELCESAKQFASLPVDGLVLGFVREGRIEQLAMDAILQAGSGLAATFHRAFEHLEDPEQGLTELRRWPQIDRVLVRPDSTLTLDHLRRWQGDLRFIVAAGSDPALMNKLRDYPELSEIHVGRAVREPAETYGHVSAAKVAALKSQLA